MSTMMAISAMKMEHNPVRPLRKIRNWIKNWRAKMDAIEWPEHSSQSIERSVAFISMPR